MGEWATDELEQCKARIAALEQHVSELEKSLENARKERDEAVLVVERVRGGLADAGVPVAVSPQEWLRVSWLANERRKAETERDAALADNAALVDVLRKVGKTEGAWGPQTCTWCGCQTHAERCPVGTVLAQPHRGAALLEEMATLRGVRAQAQADAKFVHEALGWASEWPRSLPAPSRAVVALLEQHRKALAPLQAVVTGLVEEMERTLHHREHKGGMSVPDHGDFCSAPPSMLGRLRWWAREMREALAGRTSTLLVRARNEGLEAARETMRKALPERGLISSGQVSRALSEIDALKEPEGGQS